MDKPTSEHSGPMMLVPFVENIFFLETYLHKAGMTGLLRKHERDILRNVLFYAKLDAGYSPAYLSVNIEVTSRLRALLEDKPMTETDIEELLSRAFDLAKQLTDDLSAATAKRQPFFRRTRMMLQLRHQEHRLRRKPREQV